MNETDTVKDLGVIRSVAEELPRQQARCREILEHALELGPPGMFLAMMLRQSLTAAERVSAAGDVAGMVRALADLQSYKE